MTFSRLYSLGFLSASTPQRDALVACYGGPPLGTTVRPLNDKSGDAGAGAEAELRAQVTGAQVAAVRVNAPPERGRSGALETDPGADAEAVARTLLQRHLQPVILRNALVQQ